MATGTLTVREVSDKATLHRALIRDRVAAAYHLGDLDPRYFQFCRWWGASSDDADELEAVALLYAGLRMPALLTLGSAAGVEAILDDAGVRAELPSRFYAHVMNDHMAGLQAHYREVKLRSMVRMGLARADFQRADVEDLSGIEPVGHADTADLMSLYTFYPDNFFEPYQLGTGLYFGAREQGRLVSVAGIHVYSQEYDVAALGNIVTHPDHRSRGHSRRCTARLVDELFNTVSVVALNVERDNVAAQRVYRRLGFTEHLRYVEGLVDRRA